MSYTLQVAEGLAHADARNVVHRDIKPSNMIITPEGRAKLIDMGLPACDSLIGVRRLDRQRRNVARSITFHPSRPATAQCRYPQRYLFAGLHVILHVDWPAAVPRRDGAAKVAPASGRSAAGRAKARRLAGRDQRRAAEDAGEGPGEPIRSAGELAYDLLAISERLGLQPPLPGNRSWFASVESKPSFWRRHLPWMFAVASLLTTVLGLEIYWTLTAPPANSQNPPNIKADDYALASPRANTAAAPRPQRLPIGLSCRRARPRGTKRKGSPAASRPRAEQDANSSRGAGDVIPGKMILNTDSWGEPSIPSISTTAEAIFRGRILENRQPYFGEAGTRRRIISSC